MATVRRISNPVGKQLNQFTSPLVGLERPWAELVASGHRELVVELLKEAGISMTQRRSMMAWLDAGAPSYRAEIASARSIMRWRIIFRDMGPAPVLAADRALPA